MNVRRSEKGKEIDNQQLIIEGEFINWKKHDKGKEYYIFDGKLFFEGEYKNGKEMEKIKDILMNILYYLKENILKVKDGMEKVKN